jgi:hypothetical protein
VLLLMLQDGRSRSFRSLQRLSAKMVAGGGGGAASALMCQEDQVLSALEVVRQVRCDCVGWAHLGAMLERRNVVHLQIMKRPELQ